jgi:tripartite-type tricarboxylate transporter receptor subunit TctC
MGGEEMKAVPCRAATLLVIACFPVTAFSQASTPAYPAKALRILIPFAAGGAVDTTGRLLGQKLSESFAKPVLVENRPGAAGMIAVEALLKAPADGYVMMVGAAGVLATTPAGQEHPIYDPLKDVAPVSLIATFPFVLVVNPSLPARSIAELVKLAKAKPFAISNATTGQGTATHLVAEYLSLASGVKFTHVPYKGDNPAAIDIIAGHVSMGMLTPIIIVQHVKTGRLRALAVTSSARFAPLPDLPTVAEQGYPDFAAESWHAVVVRTGTPPDIVQRLSAEIARITRESAELRTALENGGGAIVGSTPEQFGAYHRNEMAKWRKVMAAAAIKAQ